MNSLQIFRDEQFGTVRTIDEDGKILFCGKDVAEALGYKSAKDAISRHCKGATFQRPLSTGGGIQTVKFITEGDLYRLITHSRLPAAEAFEKWVFDTVLPTIRRTGKYEAQTAVLPTASAKALPIRINEGKARRNWFNFMLSALEAKLGLSKENMLHQAYESMKSEGLNIDAITNDYIESTGLLDTSTYEAICNDRVGAAELADILHANMKIVFIKRVL